MAKKRREIVRSIDTSSLSIKREINTLLLPWFVMGKVFKNSDTDVQGSNFLDGRPGTVTYKIDKDGVAGSMKIMGSAELGVPMEFDQRVFLAILAEQEERGGQTVSFKSTDIINRLKVASTGKAYKAVHESVIRLVSTTYLLENVFTSRVENKKGDTGGSEEDITELNSDVPEPETGTPAASEDRFKKENIKFMTTKLLDSVDGEISQIGGEYVSGASYSVKIPDAIYQNISSGKYFKYYNAQDLLDLKRGTVRRLYELIEFQRFDRNSQTFYYDKLAKAIPLNSKYMNKKYIIDYSEILKQQGYITDYDTETHKDRIIISFPEKGKAIASPDGNGAPTAESLKAKVAETLRKKRKSADYDVDAIVETLLDKKVNVLSLGEDGLVANVDYVLSIKKPKENFLGYLASAVRVDWATSAKKAVKKPKVDEQQDLFGKAEKSGEEVIQERKLIAEAFERYIAGMAPDQLESLYDTYGIKRRDKQSVMMQDLKVALRNAGELPIEQKQL